MMKLKLEMTRLRPSSLMDNEQDMKLQYLKRNFEQRIL